MIYLLMALASVLVVGGSLGMMASAEDGRVYDATGWLVVNLLGVGLWIVMTWMAGAFTKKAGGDA